MRPDPRHLAHVLSESLGVDLRFDLAVETGSERPAGERDPGRARRVSRRLGRAALRALRVELEGRAGVDDLAFPNPRYSLSHSRDTALAVADATASLDGIGVDLEIDRSLNPQAARFFLTEGERRWLEGLDEARVSCELLRLWCVKEAVFKANPENHGTLLGDHAPVEPAESRGRARTRAGRVVEYASWREAGTCVAVAVCR